MLKIDPCKKKIRYRWVAAAAIILLLVCGSYFWIGFDSTEIKNEKITSSSRMDDLQPGRNQAVLTLTNGTKIVLDSVHNGQLVIQGKSKITKINSGLLAYNSQPTLQNQESATVQYNVLTTPLGGQYRLILPDGSQAWLNAASSITYPTAFFGKERKVKITGEVYFEVAHNAEKPFIVEAEKKKIKVLGTSFNIKAYKDAPLMETTLITGKIKIEKKLLKPGQQYYIDKQTDEGTIKKADTNNVIAWVHGQISLKGKNLPTLMRTISRWYNVDVRFDGKIPECNFVGRIDRDVYLSKVLKALSIYGIHTRLEGRTIIVSGK